jgi:hypothetical protein
MLQLIQVGTTATLLASLLGRSARASKLLFPAEALTTGYERPEGQQPVNAHRLAKYSLVELCFLHWYTPSLFGEASGASKPSRSMGSNCIQHHGGQ